MGGATIHSVLATLLVLAVIWLAAYFVLRPRSRGPRRRSPAREPATSGETGRERFLSASASDFGIDPDREVWGVLMEAGHAAESATLVALADGSTSLSLTGGRGAGEGEPEAGVRAAARELVRLAEQHAGSMATASSFPSPAPGRVKFYVLRKDDVAAAEVAEDELAAGAHALSALFASAREVMARIRASRDDPQR